MSKTWTAISPIDGTAVFRYSPDAAKPVADNFYRDGSNRLPGGRGTALVRTAKGRYVWHHESLWQGEPRLTCTAATDADGKPYDATATEAFICAADDEDALTQWFADINKPIPLA